MRNKLGAGTVEELKSEFEHMPARKSLRPYDVIAQLAEPIASARSRGYDIDDITAILHKAGITLARNTVRTYLSRARSAAARCNATSSSAANLPAPEQSERGASVLELARARARARDATQSDLTSSFKIRAEEL